MTFWSGETLLARLPPLIKPFDPKQVDCAAYTLRMGREAYVSPSESEQDPKKITIKKLEDGESFTIPAGQFAFLLTEEAITIPRSAIAFISMKSGVKLRGLVNVSGFHVDPGYTGNLIFAVFNAGPKTAHLKRGEDCFLIWFADLDNPKTDYVKKTVGFSSIPTEVVTKISGEVMSFEGLNAKIKGIKEDYDDRLHKVEVSYALIKAIGTVLITIAVGVFAVPYIKAAWDWWQSAPPQVTTAPPAQPLVRPQLPPSSPNP